MSKVFKIIARTLGIFLEWLLIALILFLFAIRTSPVQTYLAQQATNFLSKELNTTVRIDGLSIVFFDRVALDGVFVLDQQKDTLASIHTLYVTLEELNLKKNFVKLKHVELDEGVVHINRDSIHGDYNYEFLADYFSSGKRTKKPKPFDVYLSSLELSNVDFKYDDFRKGYSDFGMDYDHIDLDKVNLQITQFNNLKGEFNFIVKKLNTKERCGFKLNSLEMGVNISPKGLKIKNLHIQTPYSKINIPKFHLLLDEMVDFETFEDSVAFDAELAMSSVSLKDVSYFATALEGMDQQVTLKAKVTEKVKNLHITDLDFSTGKSTKLIGDLVLPDFREFEKAFFNENIDYAFVAISDLKKIKLPISASSSRMEFDKYLERLSYFQAYDLRLDGFYNQFVIKSDSLSTSLGSVNLKNGILFTENRANDSYMFEHSVGGEEDVFVHSFQLGTFLNDSNFGVVDGNFSLSGEAFSTGNIDFNSINGTVNRFDYLGYAYNNIIIKDGSFKDNVLLAKVDIKDDNLNLTYNGMIDFKGNQHMQFSIDLTKAILENLNINVKEQARLTSNFSVDITGTSANNLAGEIKLNGLLYTENGKEIRVPSLTLVVERGTTKDGFFIDSELAKVSIEGKVDFTTIISDFSEQFQKVFPSITAVQTKNSKNKKKKKQSALSHFTYEIKTQNLDEFLSIFAPDLKIENNTLLKGSYDGRLSDFSMRLTSKEIDYMDMRFIGVDLDQKLTSTEIAANYKLNEFHYTDSIILREVSFKTRGTQSLLNSELSWDPGTDDESHIAWKTNIVSNNHLNFELIPSYFSINHQRWEIEKQSDFTLTDNEIHISKLKIERNSQFISIDGCISRNDADKLNFRVNDINLSEISELIGSDVNMRGTVNGWGYISNPYTNFNYIGDAAIQELYLNDQEVGDVYVQSEWNKGSESVGLIGDLTYRGNQTFKFDGNYFLEREKDNLDFDLLFDQTDLQFTNAFMDPDVINNIKGVVDGHLKVRGTPDFPKLEGEVNLLGGNAKVDILGVNFGLNGKISTDEFGFYIDNMPVTDEEGNTGSLIGSVYHTQYSDWNFDLQFDLEKNVSIYDAGVISFVPNNTTMSKFLILNTKYKEGDYYYGKAYVTGTANIFGYSDNIDITVDLKTQRGTSVNFPMYGMAELEEEKSYITFKKRGDLTEIIEPKFDFTGVNLDLNFRVTPDAKMKIIFNETTGDEITANGNGDIAIKLDNLGDLKMDGTYRVKQGLYNFAMGPIKQPFYIEDGGTISWTGDPYNATLDIKTYYEVYANFSEIAPDQLQNSTAGSNQKVQCYLGLTESLMKPTIGFDIKAPKADESGKALISRITADKDELNRQFFSLLLWKRFQPLRGTTAAGGSAAMDLVSNQINSMLSQVSKDYKLNVNLDADQVTGESTYEFGVSKGFLDNRLILNGSFGVENVSNSSQSTSALVGDVRLEYLLNESGTVRVNVFNESNDYSVIQEKNLGPFTQGAGIHYQEDFDNFDNFKLAQYFLDIFRSKSTKKYPVKRKKRQTPIPSEE